jgi:putative nucleotidyltransferase with HDIG domain
MAGPVEFLGALARTLAAMSLYPEGHASRDRALDGLMAQLRELMASDRSPTFSFLGDEVLYGTLPLRDLRQWDWSRKLSDLGIQRLQFDETATRDDLENFLDEVLARLTLKAIDTTEARQMRPSGVRYGAIGIRGEDSLASGVVPTATIAFTLSEEAEAVRWIHQEIQSQKGLPLVEAEAVVRSLSVAMHGEQHIMLPLLTLREFDEYTTTHSLNVCVLTMGLTEWLGLSGEDVRAFGVAGLLHDLGKVKIPKEVLTKPGKLDPAERALMNAHPVEGAKLILASEEDLDLAAVVAYEHHVMLNGGGYPTFRFPRDCHRASKLVHVCDVYDALRTNRPYRDAWPPDKVLAYIEERSGTEFDGTIAHAFAGMMREWEPKVAIAETEALPAE